MRGMAVQRQTGRHPDPWLPSPVGPAAPEEPATVDEPADGEEDVERTGTTEAGAGDVCVVTRWPTTGVATVDPELVRRTGALDLLAGRVRVVDRPRDRWAGRRRPTARRTAW